MLDKESFCRAYAYSEWERCGRPNGLNHLFWDEALKEWDLIRWQEFVAITHFSVEDEQRILSRLIDC